MPNRKKKRRRLRRVIDRIVKNYPKRYKREFWEWAEKRGGYQGNPRWAALASWSAMHRRWSYDQSRHYRNVQLYLQKHGAKRYLIHRAYMRSRMFLARGKHYAKMEAAYRKENRRLKKRHPKPDHQDPQGDLVYFDGKPHAGWIVRESLIPARASGIWRGLSYSGYRTPEYCDYLCRQICGAPTCPGLCAGRNSNHAKLVKPGGATDSTDSQGLSNWEAQHGYPTRHTLPNDLPHHSLTGQ